MDLTCQSAVPVQAKEGRANLPSLTGLRFVAAFLVLFAHGVHVVCKASNTQALFELGVSCGYLGMTVFFVLSGFVIHYNYGIQFLTRPFGTAFRSFAIARFARLFPMYFVTFLLCLAAAQTYRSLRANSYVFGFHLSMTQSWFYLPIHNGNWGHATGLFFPHGWSISTEIFFYLLYPLVLLPISKLRRSSSIITTGVIFTAAAFGLLSLIRIQGSRLFDAAGCEMWHPGSVDAFMGWVGYFAPPTRFLEFCLGCLAAQLYLSLEKRPVSSAERRVGLACLVIAGGSLLLLQFARNNLTVDFLRHNFLCAPSCAVLTFCLVRYQTVFSQLLNLRPVVLFGDASYSIYLLQHFLFGPFVSQISEPVRFFTVIEWVFRLSLVIGLTLATALGTYQLVEVPARNWIRQRFFASSPSANPLPWSVSKAISTILVILTLILLLNYGLYRMHQFPLMYCARAAARAEEGNCTGSLADLNAALAIAPGDPKALKQRGSLFNRVQRYQEAIADFSALLKKHPNDLVTLEGRAEAFLLSGLWQESIRDYNKMVEIAPTLPKTYCLRAAAFKKIGQFSNALADCDQVLQLNPRHAEAYFIRAQLRESTGNDSGAFSDYTDALRINPVFLDAVLGRARFRESRGKLTEACLDYERILEIDPNHAEARAKRTNLADRKSN